MTVQGSFYFGYLLSMGLGVWWLGCLAAGRLGREHIKCAAVAAATCVALAAALTFPVWSRPVAAHEINGLADLITPAGDLRTLPCHLPDPDSRMGGLDGFYAARLTRQ